MKKNYVTYFLILVLIGAVMYFLTPVTNNLEGQQLLTKDSSTYLPTSTTGTIIEHRFYSLSYSEKHEQAEWVAYELKSEHLHGKQRKRPLFQLDKAISSGSAHWNNYKNSGYSKGHLCPAGDRKFSEEAYTETFLTSNATPQRPAFNEGIWNRLEQKVRYWVEKEKHLYIITGGILEEGLPTIGSEHVAVPNYYYKILLDLSEPNIKAIAFLVPHRNSELPLYKYVTSIDILEEKTNIDFFSQLPDELEKQLEASSDYKDWSFN